MSDRAMRYVVLGAGAVGGTIGARLADAGHDVLLLARGAHAEAIRAGGLRLAMPQRTLCLDLPVVERPEQLVLTDRDVLIVATKSQDTVALLDQVALLPVARTVDATGGAGAATVGHGYDTAGQVLPIVCAQNGVDNERAALRRFAAVYGMVVMMPAEHVHAGRIAAHGTPTSGLLDVGRYPGGVDAVAQGIASDLAASGFTARATDDVMAWKWAKLLRNLGNAIEALAGHDLSGEDADIARDLAVRAREEAEACYERAGIEWVDDATWRARRGHQVDYAPVEGEERTGGSSWQSLARGAGSIEADYLNGEIVLLGRLQGVATPVNAVLVHEASAVARRRGSPGSVSPRRLHELVAAVAAR